MGQEPGLYCKFRYPCHKWCYFVDRHNADLNVTCDVFQISFGNWWYVTRFSKKNIFFSQWLMKSLLAIWELNTWIISKLLPLRKSDLKVIKKIKYWNCIVILSSDVLAYRLTLDAVRQRATNWTNVDQVFHATLYATSEFRLQCDPWCCQHDGMKIHRQEICM